MGGSDLGGFLRAHRMEGMAAMGVPTVGGWNEFDCRVCDELDDVGLCRQRLRPPLRKRDIRYGRADFSARTSRLCDNADLLAHPVLDVPAEDFFKNLNAIHTLSSGRRGQHPGVQLQSRCSRRLLRLAGAGPSNFSNFEAASKRVYSPIYGD